MYHNLSNITAAGHIVVCVCCVCVLCVCVVCVCCGYLTICQVFTNVSQFVKYHSCGTYCCVCVLCVCVVCVCCVCVLWILDNLSSIYKCITICQVSQLRDILLCVCVLCVCCVCVLCVCVVCVCCVCVLSVC